MGTDTVDLGTSETGVESQEIESQETLSEGGSDTGQAQSTETSEQTESSGATQQIDGRRGPANIRSSIKAASEALPEQTAAFKELGNAYFRDQAYRQHFSTPQEAASAKALIEGIGGVEGASALQERIQAYDAQETGLESGDPAVLDSFFKDYPKQAAELAPAYLERVAQSNPNALAEAIGPYAVDMIINAGFTDALQQAYESQDPKPLIQRMYNWLTTQAQSRETLRQTGTARNNGGVDRLQKERESLQQEREQIFQTSVTERVNSLAEPSIASEVDRYAKQYRLNDTQKTHYRKTLEQAVINEMNADQTYLKQVGLRYASKSRTRETVASYISGEFNRRVKDKAFEVVKGIYGAPRGEGAAQAQAAGPVKAGQPQTAPGGGPLKVSYVPTNDQLDTTRPDFAMMRIKGQGYLKGSNRFVTWAHVRV